MPSDSAKTEFGCCWLELPCQQRATVQRLSCHALEDQRIGTAQSLTAESTDKRYRTQTQRNHTNTVTALRRIEVTLIKGLFDANKTPAQDRRCASAMPATLQFELRLPSA